MLPKISVITITYNSEATLEETIQSVLAQAYPNLEYIIVDGLSTDGTMDVVSRYRSQISTVICEKDHGISDAFNKGIGAATGDIIGILNSDDVMLPNALMEVAKYYDGVTDVYRGNTIIWNDQTGFMARELPSMQLSLIPFTAKVSHQGMFITPQAYRKYGMYRVEIKYPMDLELLLRFYLAGAKMKQMDVDVAKFRMGGATSTPITKKKQDYMNVVLYNGGKQWQATVYYLYLYTRDLIKRILTKCFDEDFKRKLRYQALK